MIELDIAILFSRTFQNFHLCGLLFLILQYSALRESLKAQWSRGEDGKVTGAAGAGSPSPLAGPAVDERAALPRPAPRMRPSARAVFHRATVLPTTRPV